MLDMLEEMFKTSQSPLKKEHQMRGCAQSLAPLMASVPDGAQGHLASLILSLSLNCEHGVSISSCGSYDQAYDSALASFPWTTCDS